MNEPKPVRTSSLAIFSAAYFLALLPLLPRLSLWLDEILELHAVRDVDLAHLSQEIASNAGAVPLGYYPQFLLIKLLGYSPATGRLASAIFAALACFTLGLLCRRLKIRYPLLVVAIYALCPLQLRYATEARTYAQALWLIITATLVFTWLMEKITPARGILYFACILAGLYTQPFTLFVPLAHAAYLIVAPTLPNRRNLLLTCTAAIALATAGFAPWYLYASHYWRANVTGEGIRFVFRWKELSLIGHELVGAGYFGTACVLIATALGLAATILSRSQKLFWATLLIIPILGPLLADAGFGYFLAIRQFIFILPALAVLSTVGLTFLESRQRLAAAALLIAITASWIAGDIGWFSRPREDWAAASTTLRQNLTQGGCAIFVPENSRGYYTFFEPALPDHTCTGQASNQIWVAVSPYDAEPAYSQLADKLIREGYTHRTTQTTARPHIENFSR